MYYTRPHLQPLGLDLDEIDGGGCFPAQFYGRTVDDREIYIRYRGGWFRVECSDASDDGPMRVVLSAVIGPPRHGEMLVEQACDLAGLTVRGKRLELSEEALRAAQQEGWILDWSGRTTYWLRDLLVTPEGGQMFFERLAARHPDIHIVESTGWWKNASKRSRKWRTQRSLRDSVLACRGHVTFGVGADRTRLDEALGIDKSPIRLGDAFAHTVAFGHRWADPIWSNITRPPFFETLAPDIVIMGPELGGSLLTEFATDDPKGRAFVESVAAVADACFDNRIETVDLATRQVVDTMTHHAWYSVDLRDRCRENPGCFIGWTEQGTGEALRHLGIRPAMTPG